MIHAALGAPLVAAAAIKIIYDLALYAMFRRVDLDKYVTATAKGAWHRADGGLNPRTFDARGSR